MAPFRSFWSLSKKIKKKIKKKNSFFVKRILNSKFEKKMFPEIKNIEIRI
jgi:hypothetical protein